MSEKYSSIFNHDLRDPNINYKWIFLNFIVSGKSFWSGRKSSVQNCSPLFKLYFQGDHSSIKMFKYTNGIKLHSKQTTYCYGKVTHQQDKLLNQVLRFYGENRSKLLKIQQQSIRNLWKLIRPAVPLVEKIGFFGKEEIPESIRQRAYERLNSLCPGDNYLHQNLPQIPGRVASYNIVHLLEKLFEDVRPRDFDYLNKKEFKQYIQKQKIEDPYETPLQHSSKYSTSRQSLILKKVPIKQCKAYSKKQGQNEISPQDKLKLLQKRVEILSKIFELFAKEEEKQENVMSTSQSSLNVQPQMMMVQLRNQDIRMAPQEIQNGSPYQVPQQEISDHPLNNISFYQESAPIPVTPVSSKIQSPLSPFMDFEDNIMNQDFFGEKSSIGVCFQSTNQTQNSKATTFEQGSRQQNQQNQYEIYRQIQSQINQYLKQ